MANNVTAESRRVRFNPAEKRKREPALPDGDYVLKFTSMGKPGMDGWRVPDDTTKAPYRLTTVEVVAAEDPGVSVESTLNPGKNKTVMFMVNAKPIEFFIGQLHDLLRAHGYSQEVDLGEPPNFSGEDILRDEVLRNYCANIDTLLQWCVASGKTFRAHLTSQEFRGELSNQIKSFYPAEEFAESEDMATDASAEAAPEQEAESAPEVEAPAPSKKKRK
jgi:hypothetical protein